MSKSVRQLVYCALFVALSVVLAMLIRISIIPAAPFMEYSPADVPTLIATFAFGPMAGLLVTVVTAVVQGTTVSAGSGIYGIIMHIIATGTIVLVAGLIYKKNRTRKGAAIALIVGALSMTAVMVVANLFITPIFTGWPRQEVANLLLPGFIPFNLIKASINSLLTFVLYKRLSTFLNKPWRSERKAAGAQVQS